MRRKSSRCGFLRLAWAADCPRTDFLTGFLVENGTAHFGRVAGLAFDTVGALLLSDDTNGMIYRVSYGDGGEGGASGTEP